MLQAGFIVVIVAVINSIISVGYYFKVIMAMYTKEPNEERTGTPVVILCSCSNDCIEYCIRFVSILCFGSISLNYL
jgi:NADH:ubiquinone oxidoreductase subunit 2 (subunit N)